MAKMGVGIPKFIDEKTTEIIEAMKDCKPYRPFEHEVNAEFLETTLKNCKDIIRFTIRMRKEIKKIYDES